jgi:hypothetical protein
VRCAWLLLPKFKVVLADQGALNYWALLGCYFASVPKEGLPQGISFLLSSAYSEVPRGSQTVHRSPLSCTPDSSAAIARYRLTLHLSRPFASTPTRCTPVPRTCRPQRMQPRPL